MGRFEAPSPERGCRPGASDAPFLSAALSEMLKSPSVGDSAGANLASHPVARRHFRKHLLVL